MNLERSEDERRFETQQIEAALWDDGGPSSNPFAVALGLAFIVAIVALISLLWSIFETIVNVVCYCVDRASVLFNSAHSVRWLRDAAIGPNTKALIAIAGVPICARGCRSLSRGRSEISAFARRGRT
jgi:hypothetical protein